MYVLLPSTTEESCVAAPVAVIAAAETALMATNRQAMLENVFIFEYSIYC
jgi:hypothetical protein